MKCETLHHLLERVHLIAHADEAYDVPRDAAGQGDQVLLWPIGQRGVPGQSDQLRVGLGREEPGHGPILSSLDSCRRVDGFSEARTTAGLPREMREAGSF